MNVKESELKEKRPLTAWEKRRSDAAMRIEKAALKLFLTRDIDTVTVEEIASAAGISRRTFYRYFDSPDDILAAMPKRALEALARDVQARPLSESIPQVFVNAARHLKVSPEEKEIRFLANQVLHRWPVPWRRAMGKLQPKADAMMTQIVADRLRSAGRDPAPAALIATVLSTVIVHVGKATDAREDFGPDADSLEAALVTLADALTSGGPTQPAPRSDKSNSKLSEGRPK